MSELTKREIDMSHTIDDLCRENARLRRQVKAVRALLDDVPHMIVHDHTEVALEYVHRAQAMVR
jgi:hypothetical protein